MFQVLANVTPSVEALHPSFPFHILTLALHSTVAAPELLSSPCMIEAIVTLLNMMNFYLEVPVFL